MLIGTTSRLDKQVYRLLFAGYDAVVCARPRALLPPLFVFIHHIYSCRTM